MKNAPVSARRWITVTRTLLSFVLVAAAAWIAFAPQSASNNAPPAQRGTASIISALPGASTWNAGVSSFLFGTNDGYEYQDQNIETEPVIQQALHDAGVTLVRTFIPDNATDSVIEQRITTIEHIGASCLAVLTNIDNTAFNEHVVTYLGSRCKLYEFGNEPDYNKVPIDHYLAQWNATIPLLRKINPAAKFIGPVVVSDVGFGDSHYMELYLKGVKSSGVLPDAISFHVYPCYQEDESLCLASAGMYENEAIAARTLIKSILGKELPIGITEWNFDPSYPPPSYGADPNFMSSFTRTAIESMIAGGVSFACQFDAASYSGYGGLDMFDVGTGKPKTQFNTLADMIKKYRPTSGATQVTTTGQNPSLVSHKVDAVCSANNDGPGEPGSLTDGNFGNWGFWEIPTPSLPGWCAIHVSAKTSKVLLAWYSDYSYDYIDNTAMAPLDYDISVSSNSTDGNDGSWHTAMQVRGNQARAREHVVAFDGMSWVKMTILKGFPQTSQPYIRIDELQVFDANALGNDTFFFSGDSITAIAYNRLQENSPSFADDMARCDPYRTPLTIDGGFGGETSLDAMNGIASWLKMNPDVHYWLLGWGSNDALQGITPDGFRQQMQHVISAILAAGRVPVLAHIPYSTFQNREGLDTEIQQLNAVIDQLTASNHLIPGPDLYTLMKNHPQYLSSDGLHPTNAGAVAMNQLWFQTLQSPIGLNEALCK